MTTAQRAARIICVRPSQRLRNAINADPRSLRQLATLSGVDVGILSRFVRGERTPTLEQLDRLAPVLHLELRRKKGH